MQSQIGHDLQTILFFLLFPSTFLPHPHRTSSPLYLCTSLPNSGVVGERLLLFLTPSSSPLLSPPWSNFVLVCQHRKEGGRQEGQADLRCPTSCFVHSPCKPRLALVLFVLCVFYNTERKTTVMICLCRTCMCCFTDWIPLRNIFSISSVGQSQCVWGPERCCLSVEMSMFGGEIYSVGAHRSLAGLHVLSPWVASERCLALV